MGTHLWRGNDGPGLLTHIVAGGGVFVFGQTFSLGAGAADFYLLRVRNSGFMDWYKTYGTEDSEEGTAIAANDDGGFILAGSQWVPPQSNILLIETDSHGELAWSTTIATEFSCGASSVVPGIDEGYAVGGWLLTSSGQTDCFLVRVDADGNVIGQHSYGGADDDFCNAIVKTTDGFLLAGWTDSMGEGKQDVYVVRIGTQGEVLWEKTYGGPESDGARDVIAVSEGGFVLAGWTESFGMGGSDVYLIKIDAAGELLWQRTFGGEAEDRAHSVIAATDGGYVIAGATASSGEGGSDVYVVKTDINGEL